MNNSNSLSVRQMAKWLKKIHMSDGDILAIKSSTSLANKESIDQVASALDRLGLHKSLVVVVDNFDDISVLNETEMNKRGWFNMKKLSKFIKVPNKETQ